MNENDLLTLLTRLPSSPGKEALLIPPTLVLGIGNIDRQDDGVAWHLVNRLALRLGAAQPLTPGTPHHFGNKLALRLELQLTPDLAEDLAQFARACFIDAHTGNQPQDIHLQTVEPGYQPSPLSHHLTPASTLALAEALFGHAPQAVLLSIRGHAFGFSQTLSPQTEALIEPALNLLLNWLIAPIRGD